MRHLGALFAALWLAGGLARAGVGAWTATPNPRAQSVVVAPDGAVYTDTGEFGVDLARSADHGVSWQTFAGPGQVGLSFYGTLVLAVDPAGAIYAAFNAGGHPGLAAQLFVSRDGGASWTLLLSESTQFLDLRIDPFSTETLYLYGGIPGALVSGLVAGGRLQRSTDSGMHWTFIDDTLVAGIGAQGSVMAFAIDPNTPGRLYAASVNPLGLSPPVPAFYASSDRGTTWTRSTAIPPATFTTLIVDPLQPSRILGGGPSGIYRSDDAGQAFALKSALPATRFVADPLHAGSFLVATPANGVLASSDAGGTWTPLNAGLTNLAVDAVAIDAAGGYLYAATSTGVFVYQFPDPGALVLNAGHPFTVTLSATDPHSGAAAPGVATQVNDLWGYFSIPAITGNPNNPEVFVKMLDGTAINGRFWFFYGGLTDVEYTLTVIEDATGAQKNYTKPAGSECGGSDTAAFTP